MAVNHALPARFGPDQRGVHMNDLALRDPRINAGRHRAPENLPEPRLAPALADPGQARMIRKPVVKTAADELAGRDVRLRLAHQTAVMHKPEQEPGQHQADRDLRIDPRTTVVRASAVGDLLMQPARIENPVDARLDVIVGNQLLQRTGDEQLKLGGRLSLQHLVAFPIPETASGIMNHETRGFSTASCSLPSGGRSLVAACISTRR